MANLVRVGGGGNNFKSAVIYDNGTWLDGFSLGGSVSSYGSFSEQTTYLNAPQRSWEEYAGSSVNGPWGQFGGYICHITAKRANGDDLSISMILPINVKAIYLLYELHQSWGGIRFISYSSSAQSYDTNQMKSFSRVLSLNNQEVRVYKIWVEPFSKAKGTIELISSAQSTITSVSTNSGTLTFSRKISYGSDRGYPIGSEETFMQFVVDKSANLEIYDIGSSDYYRYRVYVDDVLISQSQYSTPLNFTTAIPSGNVKIKIYNNGLSSGSFGGCGIIGFA